MGVSPRPLPEPDLEALFAVLAVVHATLHADGLPDDMVGRLGRRLADRGLLPRGASKGELNALLADLAQRMHWAMGGGSDDRYPAAAARGVTFEVGFPPGAGAAAEAFRAEAVMLGGRSAPEPIDRSAPGRLVAVSFPELPPDPAFQAREARLVELATRHGGEYCGYYSGGAVA